VRTSTTESAAIGAALAVCILTRLPHHLLGASGTRGWALGLVVVVTVVNGARAVARAPFTLSRSVVGRSDRGAATAAWAAHEAKALAATVAVGVALTLPLYVLLRATPAWWLLAWVMFAAVTLVWQAAMPLTLKAQAGPLTAAPAALGDRVRSLAARAGVDVGDGVLVAAKPGRRSCNAYVVGLGRSRRVVLEGAVAAWPPELVDQVVAHEIGHWRLRHTASRLPLALAAQLATLAVAAWVLGRSPVLRWAGVADAGDPRSYPLLLLVTPLLALPGRCVLAWRDRAQERAADRFALALLDAPSHFAAMLERAADESSAPRRLPWWRLLTASHPPIEERAVACTRFASTA
jgi:STE24 endopeptidase